MHSTSDYSKQLQALEQTGIVVMHNVSRFGIYNKDLVCPHVSLMVCERGTARALYDMQEQTQHPNEIACLMPGHILRLIESSDDFSCTIAVLSHQLLRDLQFHVFSHDYDKFNVTPICPLTETEAQRMLGIADQLETIAGHSEKELPHRYQMLLALLAVGYEYLNFYRREQDIQWSDKRHPGLLNRFCNLVVEHYKESREVKFYARMLNLTPKTLTNVITTLTNGMSPADWIEQYVAVQAKYNLRTQHRTVKEVAFSMGFGESASFCRFFKRVTGQSPQEYRETLQQAINHNPINQTPQ